MKLIKSMKAICSYKILFNYDTEAVKRGKGGYLPNDILSNSSVIQ